MARTPEHKRRFQVECLEHGDFDWGWQFIGGRNTLEAARELLRRVAAARQKLVDNGTREWDQGLQFRIIEIHATHTCEKEKA